jgi:iron(III) transport system substrate-binding protein
MAVAAASLAACGGDSSSASDATGRTVADVVADLEGLTGDERTQHLLELAQEEGGRLSFYTSYSSDLADEVAGAFGDAYGIDVGVYRAEPETIVQRLAEEAKAGFRGADVVENGGLEMLAANADDLLDPYTSPSETNLVEGAGHDGWTSESVNTFVLSWNTDLVPESERPTSWEELADPKWKGRLALDGGDVEWYKTLRDWLIAEKGMSDGDADALFEAIAQNAFVVKGHSAAAQLQAIGEFALFVNFLHVVERFKNEGNPLDWQPAPVAPIVTKTDGVGIVADSIHPATAMLFVDWLLGDGQELLGARNVATRRDLSASADVETLLVDLESLAAAQDEWLRRYEELLALGTAIGGG